MNCKPMDYAHVVRTERPCGCKIPREMLGEPCRVTTLHPQSNGDHNVWMLETPIECYGMKVLGIDDYYLKPIKGGRNETPGDVVERELIAPLREQGIEVQVYSLR